MVVPLAARWVAAGCGILLVLGGWQSVIGTLIVPRPVGSWLTRFVDRVVLGAYMSVTRPVTDWVRRDRILATQAAAILVGQLAGWLIIFLAGYTLMLWPSPSRNISSALADAGSSIFTLGFAEPAGTTPAVIVFIAAATGMIVIALQIGYLPTLYAAFNRRETQVALLVSRAGFPSWGPELLARTHYALGTGTSTINTLPDLYQQWERWSSDVAESHTTYLPLVRFRSPQPYSSWVTALLSVLDSAALILSLSPEDAPTVDARLCLRARVRLPEPHRQGHGRRRAEGGEPGRRDQPDVPGVPRRRREDGQRWLPHAARPGRRLARLRRLAGQLRKGGLRDRRDDRRGPRAVVGTAPPPDATDPSLPAAHRPSASTGRVEYMICH